MTSFDEPSSAARPAEVSNPVAERDLERALEVVPRGAAALCGLAVALLIVAWLAVYFGVFLPRGPVS